MAKVLITTALHPHNAACSISTVVVDCSMAEAQEIVNRCNDMLAEDIVNFSHGIARTALIISDQAKTEIPRLANTPEILHAAEFYALSFENNGPSGAMKSLERLIGIVLEKA